MKRILVLAAALAVAGTAAAQQGTLEKIKSTGAITIGHRDASVPFSYYDDKQQPIGYSMDLCMKIVDAVKKNLNMPNIKVNYQLVTSANRIPLMANGTIDLECGSTTNNLARQEQVWFTITHFVTANRWIAKKSAKVKSLQDDEVRVELAPNVDVRVVRGTIAEVRSKTDPAPANDSSAS